MNDDHATVALHGAYGFDEVPAVEPRGRARGRYGRQNLWVVLGQVCAWAVLLGVADAPLPWGLRGLAVVGFCLLMQGVFSMIHEYCHRNAHSDPRWNELIGWVTCTLFGTAPTLLRVQHWGHHRRNRTRAERADFVHDGESRLSKTLQYYVAILGGIWLGCAVFPLLAVLTPYRVSQRLAASARSNTFAAGFGEFERADWRRMRAEALGSVACWGLLIAYGPWHAETLGVCYAAFAFSWSSLQWVYHMRTPIHVVEGAYNLRAPRLLRMLFLNFNYNLSHHRNPSAPWQELHRRSDLRETQPLWYRYLLVFRPPIPFPSDFSFLEKRYF